MIDILEDSKKVLDLISVGKIDESIESYELAYIKSILDNSKLTNKESLTEEDKRNLELYSNGPDKFIIKRITRIGFRVNQILNIEDNRMLETGVIYLKNNIYPALRQQIIDSLI